VGLPINDTEDEIDKIKSRELAAKNMEEAARYKKTKFDKNKAKVTRFRLRNWITRKSKRT